MQLSSKIVILECKIVLECHGKLITYQWNIELFELFLYDIFQQMNVKRYNVFINTQGFLNSIC